MIFTNNTAELAAACKFFIDDDKSRSAQAKAARNIILSRNSAENALRLPFHSFVDAVCPGNARWEEDRRNISLPVARAI